MTTPTPTRSRVHRAPRSVVVLAIVLVAASMRSPVSSLGALLADIEAALEVAPVVAGLLTATPPLVFGLAGATVPRLTTRLRVRHAITGATVLIAFGTGLRGGGTLLLLLVGTVVVMLGIAVANVLLPVVVRSDFPSEEGWMTGLYVSVMQLGAAAGASLTVPIADAAGGWRAGLAWWAVPATLGLLVWLPVSGRVSAGANPDEDTGALAWRRLLRDHTARAVTWLFGLQSTVAFVVMGWLPTIYRDAGLSPTTSGTMLAVAILVSIPMSFALPTWLGRRTSQSGFVWLISTSWAAGFAGLMLVPTWFPWLWAALVGLGLASFPVALLLMGLRSATVAQTARLSAFAQGVGYLVALPAPLLFGVLHDAAGGWGVPLAILMSLLVPLTWFGHRAGRPTHVGTS